MKLTRDELIRSSNRQLAILGIRRHKNSGWLKEALKSEFADDIVIRFIAAKQRAKESETRQLLFDSLPAPQPKAWAPVKPTDGAADRWANDFYEANHRNLE